MRTLSSLIRDTLRITVGRNFAIRGRRWPWLLFSVLAAVGGAAGVLIAGAGSHRAAPSRPPPEARVGHGSPSGRPPVQTRPNIVFVLTDDLSLDLLAYMPHVQAMERMGLTFSNYFVSDSLCCPSRSSILTGNFPHDTHVFSNVGKNGGFNVFHARGEERHTFAVALQKAGYRTALMGKYLNGYLDGQGAAPSVVPSYVPPGWSTWDGVGNGYPEFNYLLNHNGVVQAYGNQPSDYLTDVLTQKGLGFIDESAAMGTPFFLELATFAPHEPYIPAPRDSAAFPGLQAPRPANFDVLPSHAPRWLAGRPPLNVQQIDEIDRAHRLRAQSVQAVDSMIAQIETALTRKGLARNTYLVFSSDNGLHLGQYRLTSGKLTAFDTDIHVPLIVVGPRVPAGETVEQMTENVDLASTFAALGGIALPSDGHDLMRLLRGEPAVDWRNAVLVEHRGPPMRPNDPDFQQPAGGNPTSYEAIRTPRYLYVEYRDGEREYYNLTHDPFELHNLSGTLAPATLALLHLGLANLKRCHTGLACWAAAHLPSPGQR